MRLGPLHISLAVLCLSATTALSQACDNVFDPDFKNEPIEVREAAYNSCLKQQNSQISDLHSALTVLSQNVGTLKQQLTELADVTDKSVPAIGQHAKTKAVVAYTSQAGENPCPKGWRTFDPANDRFIVGAGGKYPKVGEKGGTESVILTPDQIPTHNHAIPGFDKKLVLEGRDRADWLLFSTGHQSHTDDQGGSKPHDNMPPYIALFYCIDDT